ncbi:MAG: hypothetical protein ACI82A_002877 [Candidatus Azotimanducaceae bacterium]|jgi:hypothetical protein
MTLPCSLLEVGSGSGQHAIRFATALPHVTWQPTDQGDYYPGLVDNIRRLASENVLPPRYLDLTSPDWPDTIDCLYSANVIHIMPAALLPQMFVSPASRLMFYGPFKYHGEFTSDSNANFDLWLKDRNPLSGIRDIEALSELAAKSGYRLTSDTPMPANNQFLVFER